MSLSSALFRERTPRTIERGVRLPPGFVEKFSEYATNTDAGVYVDADSAMRHDAVWSCITKKAQDIAMLPVDVVRYVNGARQPVEPTPQIIAAPSANVADPMDWRYQVAVAWFRDGNAWGQVTKTTPDMRYPLRVELLSPGAVRCQLDGKRVRFYVNQVETELWPLGDLWHSPAYTMPGQLLGLSPIAYHATSIGVGLAAEKFGAQFFPYGGPSWIWLADGDPGSDGAKALKKRVTSLMWGNRDPLVIPKGFEPKQITVNPDDSQFIETMRYSVEQVCRVFDEDPADHGASGGGSALTYANRSDADLARYKRRQFWVTKMQNCLTVMVPKPQVVKLNASALLMMTAKERREVQKLRLQMKVASVNEIRREEDEPPFDGDEFNEPGVPGGMTPDPPAPTKEGE